MQRRTTGCDRCAAMLRSARTHGQRNGDAGARTARRGMTGRRRILVTGGLGFIGVHLCRALLAEEPALDLWIVDNLSSTRMAHDDLLGRARVFVQDLLDFDPHGERFDEIYHLA